MFAAAVLAAAVLVAAVLAAAVLVLAFALAGALALPAGAHDEVGEIAAEITSDPDDPAEITIRVRVVYSDDGHPVEDDAVVQYLVGGEPEDVAHARGEMTRVGDGQYEATVSLPGPADYRVTVISENPQARHETVHTVEAAPTTTLPADDDAGAADGGGGDDGVTISWPVVVAIVVFLGLVGGVVFVAARQRRM